MSSQCSKATSPFESYGDAKLSGGVEDRAQTFLFWALESSYDVIKRVVEADEIYDFTVYYLDAI